MTDSVTQAAIQYLMECRYGLLQEQPQTEGGKLALQIAIDELSRDIDHLRKESAHAHSY